MLLKDNGMLLANVDPLLQLTVMYPFAIYGSVVSDLDHNWDSCPSKDVISFIINRVLHLSSKEGKDRKGLSAVFDARHRSWQTHSDLFMIVMVLAAGFLMNQAVYSADQAIIRLICMGLVLGVLSHLFLDMLTPEGVWSVLSVIVSKAFNLRFLPKKVHLVPKSEFFKTGGPWENIIRWIMWVICFILLAIIIFPSILR